MFVKSSPLAIGVTPKKIREKMKVCPIKHKLKSSTDAQRC